MATAVAVASWVSLATRSDEMNDLARREGCLVFDRKIQYEESSAVWLFAFRTAICSAEGSQ